MSFGEPSPDPVETADRFMVGGAIMAPPPWNIGLNEIQMCGPLFSKISQRALSMTKNAWIQKTDATLKNQLFKIYNFVAWLKNIRPLLRF